MNNSKMDKFKSKLNNSVTIGKTATRKPTTHSKSFFVDSAQHTLTHALRQSSKPRKRAQSGSVHKLTSNKSNAAKQYSMSGSMAVVQQNRKFCSQMSTQLQTSIIGKTLKVNKMLK